jgi:hypothetical protein
MNTPVGGRLELFLQNWRAIRRDPWILDTVQGIRLDFLTTPVQSYLPNPYFHKKADQDMIDAEVMNLVQKNAVCSLETASVSLSKEILCTFDGLCELGRSNRRLLSLFSPSNLWLTKDHSEDGFLPS